MPATRPRTTDIPPGRNAMAQFRIPPPPRLRPAVAYAVAVLLPLAALAVEESLRRWTEPIPFVLFFFVVSVASSVGGWAPGFVSVAFSAICGWVFVRTSPDPDRASGAL